MASLFDKTAIFRENAPALPDKPVAMSYDMRAEVTWTDFTNRTNPLGTPKAFVQEMHTAFVDGEQTYLPDPDGRAFRHAAARYLGVEAKNILLGTSATQLITYTACVFDYCTVGVSIPCPLSYETAIGNAGHSIQELVNLYSFVCVDADAAFSQGSFQGALLANPSYPASRLLPRQTLVNYLEKCDWVIVDESNIELSFGGESLVDLIEQYPNLILIRNASTTFGMPGVPISYLVANEAMVSQIEQFYAGADIGMFGEVLANQFNSQQDYLDATHDYLDSEIPWMQCMLNLIPGVSIYPAESNYVLCELDLSERLCLGVGSVEELVLNLQLAGFLVDDLHDVPGLPHDGFFCVTVRLREDNNRLIEVMNRIIKTAG